MIHLTTEQRNAIECTGTSVALSAGAGCGKTFVLTQRFIASLAAPNGKKSRPARLNQLIAITFTDAAAREMRSRIRQACYDELQLAKSAEAQQHWLRHLREIDSARISTIHAFCASLLRTHAAQAGLDPTFGVLDQTEADVLQYDITDDVLREQLENLDTDTLDLAAAFGLGRLKEQIAELLSHRHDEAFHAWLSETPERLVANWGEWHHKYAVPNAAMEIAAEAPVESLVRHLNSVDSSRKNGKFVEARAALLEILPRLQRNENITAADLDSIRESAKVQGICGAKDWQASGSYDGYRDACKELRDAIDKFRPLPFNPQAAMETARLGLALLKLTEKIASVYDNQKRAQGKLDFDDLLAKAFDLISRPENADLAKRMADDLRLLLVDEFQDTDELQANLVTKLCGPAFDAGRLFFVGDFKQSIYRFRGAEPAVFHELRQKVKEKGRLPLTLNFRSQPEVLNFLNALFCDTFRSEHEVYEKLRPKRKQLTEPPAVEFLWTITPDKNNHKSGTAQQARRQEARSIACRLRQLIDDPKTKPVVDKETKTPRPLQLSDIAILFRTLGDVQAYEEALREYDLDYY